eukprot:6546464-Pyramimonas_sp.AAC.1
MSAPPQLLRQLRIAAVDLPYLALGLLDVLRLAQIQLQLRGGRSYGLLALAQLLQVKVLCDVVVRLCRVDLVVYLDHRADKVHRLLVRRHLAPKKRAGTDRMLRAHA